MVFFSPELEPLLADMPPGIRSINIETDFEEFLATGSDDPVDSWLEDEYEVCAIDYTSGTMGRPKGVMYHYRGAYGAVRGSGGGQDAGAPEAAHGCRPS